MSNVTGILVYLTKHVLCVMSFPKTVFSLSAKYAKNVKYFLTLIHKLFTCVKGGFQRFKVSFDCKNNYFKIEKELKPHLAVRYFSGLTI